MNWLPNCDPDGCEREELAALEEQRERDFWAEVARDYAGDLEPEELP